MSDQKTELTGQEARQGYRGKPVLYVLIGGLVLAAFYMIGSMMWISDRAAPEEGRSAREPSPVSRPSDGPPTQVRPIPEPQLNPPRQPGATQP